MSSALRSFALPTVDWAALGFSILRPSRPRLDEVRGVALELLRAHSRGSRASGARSAARTSREALGDLWESMTTRLGREDLLANPRRQFLPYLPIGTARRKVRAAPSPTETPTRFLTDAPGVAELMIALLAADPQALATAEQAALEACARLRPWGVTPPQRVAWILLQHQNPWPIDLGDIFEWPQIAAAWSVDLVKGYVPPPPSGVLVGSWAYRGLANIDPFLARGRSLREAKERFGGVIGRAEEWTTLWSRWQFLTGIDARIASCPFVPRSLEGRRFADLPDVADAGLTVWRLGYLLGDIRGNVVILGTPADFNPVTTRSWRQLQRLESERWGSDLIVGNEATVP